MLKRHCIDKLGVKHLIGNVVDVNLDEQGAIGTLVTDTQGLLHADLYVDCTGFKSLLLGDALGIRFNSIADTLLVDNAIAIQMPYEQAQSEIASATLSTAQEAGWIWDIGLQSRRGTGHVYSSKYISHDEAEHCLRQYLGPKAADLPAKHIKMNCGYREKFWHKNCVAIGLSAAFVEPLEASAIFLIEASANMVAELFPRNKQLMEASSQQFNDSFRFRWHKTIDFIKLHYVLSKRKSPFWLANQQVDTIPDSLSHVLQQWQHRPVSKYDFAHVFEPFPQDSYQYVLYGMGYQPDLSANQCSYSHTESAAQLFERVSQMRTQFDKHLISNRELIEKVKKYGFQKL